MKNYYVLKKIKKEDLPYPELLSDFDECDGFSQMQEAVANGDIYICTDGSEEIDGEIRIDLYEE